MIEFKQDFRGKLTNERFYLAGQRIDPAAEGISAEQVAALIAEARAEKVAPPKPKRSRSNKAAR